ncbi:MAG: hypothetical protein A2469_00330 [Candidatus Magasanikbacteria bacterium RIFOXYC2_FULL_40_16]|uniref:HTH cro/C1-type domain-containing protein n=2 Tax=Candidatus Magasanikiibacteriota TaxID=1752731 RepID=A0A1F6P384_9BACT|nr:MAG: hypothetical protein A2224_00150 [Candidatus Magasanikbacteria bacterium RIFOXYA2_FULL_40_20]OGH86829.1 MAG: hypothetical protein A2301_02890 [Candidatus Magasanikbacteria bacterium RIFOXYB2_FULL_40_13]OGH87106.1 MAG: hypothetical protein A2206_01920 [Candidatus Magasanikbacteria bacterium RIFOXYA1_FULL_40_8]OGH90433.1 MAG: hypothetical protein A2469_00330 [Candidatus Magasanikbacteria bacterium RIFOXYC2_FULL_40_16]
METELQKALKLYLINNPGSERELADKFEVAVSSVKRWLSGETHPLPRMARDIINHLKSKS